MNLRRRPVVLGATAGLAVSALPAANAAAQGTLDRTLRAHPHLQYGAQREPGST